MPAIRSLVIAFGIVLMLAATALHARAEITDRAVTRAFLSLLVGDASDTARAAELIETHWEPSFLPMALEVIRLTRSAEVSGTLVRLMEGKAGAGHGRDLDAWQREMWNAPEARHPRYAAFKSALYSLIDPRFSAYFDTAGEPLIRLDEIVWGGVRQDGIPPLRKPAMLAAEDAGYIEDDHIVFGISVNGDARAYPKRILGWHEMFVDTVGGVPVAGVYCTLCGTVILYPAAGVQGLAGFRHCARKRVASPPSPSRSPYQGWWMERGPQARWRHFLSDSGGTTRRGWRRSSERSWSTAGYGVEIVEPPCLRTLGPQKSAKLLG